MLYNKIAKIKLKNEKVSELRMSRGLDEDVVAWLVIAESECEGD